MLPQQEFSTSVRHLIVFNHILIVLNSSLNFAIYCKDLVFRQCVRKVYDKLMGIGGRRGVGGVKGGASPGTETTRMVRRNRGFSATTANNNENDVNGREI
jgi:hypothetical protein